MLEVLSGGPGRLSLRFPPCRDRPALASALETTLRRLPGVNVARVRPLTARILVRFDPERLDADRVRRAVLARTPPELLARDEEPGRWSGTGLAVGGVGAVWLLEKVLLGATIATRSPLLGGATAVVAVIHHAGLVAAVLSSLRAVRPRRRPATA